MKTLIMISVFLAISAGLNAPQSEIITGRYGLEDFEDTLRSGSPIDLKLVLEKFKAMPVQTRNDIFKKILERHQTPNDSVGIHLITMICRDFRDKK